MSSQVCDMKVIAGGRCDKIVLTPRRQLPRTECNAHRLGDLTGLSGTELDAFGLIDHPCRFLLPALLACTDSY